MSDTEDDTLELALLLDAIYRKYHYDFRSYSYASLKRRLTNALSRFNCPTISRLQERVLHEPAVFDALLGYLTVQVSEMFRDPSYFLALRKDVVPYLRTYPSLKVWVPGCATGEEAYSIAIILAEEGLLDRTLIYATDIHAPSLRIAESGVYDVHRFRQFSQSYQLSGGKRSLSDYYTAGEHSAVLDRSLRKAILFSDHSLATDSAFAEVELISCRNVLIYFERDLQDRVIGLLRDALVRRGFLGLGQKETLRFSAHSKQFSDFDVDERIYQKA